MRRATFYLLSLFFFMASSQLAQAQVIYSFGTYSQNFDTLASTGTANPWVDNTTLLGWYSTERTYNASDGSSYGASLYSYGGGITNPPSDRALGSITSATIPQIRYAVQLLNNTTDTILTLNLSYFGEQWRKSGGGVANALNFDYLITASSANQINGPGYTPDSALNFTALHIGTPATALDGNDPANRISLSDSITGISWAPGQYLWLRWTDNRLVGNINNGLAIDDLSFSAAVPEPGVIASIGVLGLGYFALRNLRSKKKEKVVEEADESKNIPEPTLASV